MQKVWIMRCVCLLRTLLPPPPAPIQMCNGKSSVFWGGFKSSQLIGDLSFTPGYSRRSSDLSTQQQQTLLTGNPSLGPPPSCLLILRCFLAAVPVGLPGPGGRVY